ncbi:MAG: DUF108 domain-containing protein [Acidimicrobiia bacterium]|nr:DUF108 domain-containing protein [Acidimicrobiia bacterium]MYF84334.1 DUF108 domain-containing protein [Acidimicrobiia bacterium]
MSQSRPRIGIVGYGLIGSYVYEQISSRPELGLEVAFVHNRSPERVAQLPSELVLEDLGDFARHQPDLVVELAHASVTMAHGAAFLRHTDYMPLSLTALADADLERELLDTAEAGGTRLFIPHGAVVGLEAIGEGRDQWDEVTMVMRKSPSSIDFSEHPTLTGEGITEDTVIYDGPTRGICPLFPRNVNSHAALALGGIGFDRTRSVLEAVTDSHTSDIEITARGEAADLTIRRVSPMKGVSGMFTLISALGSVVRAKSTGPGLQIC